VQEVVKRGVGDRPGGLVVDRAALGRHELAEVEARIGAGPAVVDQAAHDAVVARPGRCGDRQQQGLLALAGPGGHRLEGVVGDDVQLVDDGKGRVPALQGARVGRQREQGGIGVGLQQVVLEDLHPGVQRGVELHHPAGGVEDDPGLPLVGGDADDLGALYAVGQQPVQPQGGGQGALAVAGRDGDERLAGLGSSSTPRTISRCQGRSFRRRRAPVPFGTVTYRSMKATARDPPRFGSRRRSSGGA
jgi:hypothetical protein